MFPGSEQWLYFFNSLASRLINALRKPVDRKLPLNILIVKLDEIGDMATATHVFPLLRQEYSNAAITLFCKPFNVPLIVNDPNIDHIVTKFEDLRKHYDIVVELRGTWKTLWKTLWFWPARRTDRGTVRWRNRGRQWHEVDTNYEIIRPLLSGPTHTYEPKLYYSEADQQAAGSFLTANGITRYAIFHTGARRILRQWPGERFAAIALHLKNTYKLDIVFAGTVADEPFIENIRARIPFNTFKFTADTTLSQFAALCSGTAFFLGNESGPLHIANAFNVPLIGLYGPGVPHVFYPRGHNAFVVHHVLDCNPCDQVHCVRPDNPCINLITIQEVLVCMAKLLR